MVDAQRVVATEEELIARARELVPFVRARADRAEAERRMPAETDRAFRETGLYRALQPAEFGGLELRYGVHTELAAEIARGCPSSAWVLGVTICHAFIFGMFPPQAQAEFWGGDPGATLATSFFADRASAVRERDGFRLDGRWKYSSGVDHAQGIILMAAVTPPGGGAPEPYFLFAPREAYRIEDTWHAAGLIGTGSNDVLLDGLFIPAHRALPVLETATGATPGGAYHRGYLYRLPLFAIFGYTLIGTALGAVRGALEALTAEMVDRASVTRVKLREQQSVQLRVAEAQAELDAAWALLRADRDGFTAAGLAGELPDAALRVRYRLHLGYAAKLCVQATERLYPLVGAQGMAANHPLQRAARDVHAVAQHIGLVWDVQAINYGAVALGLEAPDKRI